MVRQVHEHNWLRIEQKQNPEVEQLLCKLRDGDLDSNQYAEKDGLLMHKHTDQDGNVTLRYFVPRYSRLGLLRIYHDEQCHVGADKTFESIARHFWFPKMRTFIQNYIHHCIVCAVKKTRTGPMQGFIKPIPKLAHPFATLHVDCLGPMVSSTSAKYRYVLVVIDAFTKYCLLLPMRRVTATETKQHFHHILSLFGTPTEVIMDAGTNFTSKELTAFLTESGIKYHVITPDVHRANGQVERYMRTIMNLLRVESTVKSGWASNLWRIQLVLNSTVQKSTQCTPLHLLLGIDQSIPLIREVVADLSTDLTPLRSREVDRQRVAERLAAVNRKTISQANSKRRDTFQVAVGDFVLLYRTSELHNSKLNFELLGPFEVIQALDHDRFLLK